MFPPFLSTDCSMVKLINLREFPSSTYSAVALHPQLGAIAYHQEFCETLQSSLQSALKFSNEHSPGGGSFQSSSA